MDRAHSSFIRLERAEYERLTSGLTPKVGLPECAAGLWVVPIPGELDYLAFPIKGPREPASEVRHGTHCKIVGLWSFGSGAFLRCTCG